MKPRMMRQYYYYLVSDGVRSGVFTSAKHLGFQALLVILGWLEKHPELDLGIAINVIEMPSWREARAIARATSKQPFVVADILFSAEVAEPEEEHPSIVKAHRLEDHFDDLEDRPRIWRHH